MKNQCDKCAFRRGDIFDGVCNCAVMGDVDLPTFKCPAFKKPMHNVDRFKTADEATEAFSEYISQNNPEQDPEQGATYNAADAMSFIFDEL